MLRGLKNGLGIVLLIAFVYLLAVPHPVSARSLLCTNSDSLTENSVTSVSEFLSKDSGSLTVFDPEQDMPQQEFETVFIIEVTDRLEIIPACGEYAGIDGDLLTLTARELTAQIGEEKEAAPGLPAAEIRSVGGQFSDGDQTVFLQVTSGSGALELLWAIAVALDGKQTNCLVDLDCLALMERW